MKCGECGGEFRDVQGGLEWEDYYAGKVSVAEVAYQRCDGCGETLLPPEALDAVAAERERKLDEWLQNRPLKDFWDSRQVTNFLSITRQALSKGVQINNLVYKTKCGGKYFYLADSVRQYKKTGDGRMRLEFAVETTPQSVPVTIVSDYDDSGQGYDRSGKAVQVPYAWANRAQFSETVGGQEARYAWQG